MGTNQTTVTTTTIGGAATLVLVWTAGQLGLDMPAEIGGAIVLLGTGLAGRIWPRSTQ